MKKFIFSCGFVYMSLMALPQSLIGRWQLMKQTNCIEEELDSADDDGVQDVLNDMKGLNNKTPQILQFKDQQNGEESTHLLHKSKASNRRSFLYKLNEGTLYILDKKSHTITASFAIDALQSDSLILSNTSRPCETRIFIKVND